MKIPVFFHNIHSRKTKYHDVRFFQCCAAPAHLSSVSLPFTLLSIGSSGSNCSWSRTEGKTAAGDFRIGGETGDAHEFDFRRDRAPSERSAAPPSEGSVRSSRSHSYSLKQGSARAAPGSPSARLLASIPPELSGSRRSCNTANGEFFVDIM